MNYQTDDWCAEQASCNTCAQKPMRAKCSKHCGACEEDFASVCGDFGGEKWCRKAIVTKTCRGMVAQKCKRSCGLCTKAPCTHPKSLPGYDFSAAGGVLAFDQSFAPTDVACDTSAGYSGFATPVKCSTPGTDYTVSGCKATDAPTNEAPTESTESPIVETHSPCVLTSHKQSTGFKHKGEWICYCADDCLIWFNGCTYQECYDHNEITTYNNQSRTACSNPSPGYCYQYKWR